MLKCKQCGKSVSIATGNLFGGNVCPECQKKLDEEPILPGENTSGRGARAFIPDEIRGWNWGAFLMNWLWAAFNGAFDTTTLVLFATLFIPCVGFATGLGLAIYCGTSGSERSWRRKRWESVEHFKSVQQGWAIAGFCIWGLAILMWIIVLSGAARR
jgi:hypothetical protein